MEIDTSTTSGKIAVMSAFERGEKIEQKGRFSCAGWVTKDVNPVWNWPYVDFRIAPKPDPYADLKTAFARGEVIELNWSRDDEEPDWKISISPDWSCFPQEYRIKPTPKRVPLEAKDVPPVCWIGNGLSSSGSLVLVVGSERIQFVGRDGIMDFTFGYLMDHDLKYSIDRKEWHECSKPEESK